MAESSKDLPCVECGAIQRHNLSDRYRLVCEDCYNALERVAERGPEHPNGSRGNATYEPTHDEIAAATKKIRRTWSKRIERVRRGGEGEESQDALEIQQYAFHVHNLSGRYQPTKLL